MAELNQPNSQRWGVKENFKSIIFFILLLSSTSLVWHGVQHVSHSRQETDACQLCQTNFTPVDVLQVSLSTVFSCTEVLIPTALCFVYSCFLSLPASRAPPFLVR